MRSTRRLRYLSLAAVIFFTVSGGPYGLEPLVLYGKDFALLLLCFVPLCWDIPSILMVFELNSLMPVHGGYYQWVKRALGIRFAFYEGWWTWLYTFVDLAIYPGLFVEYLSFFFPAVAPFKIPVCIGLVWIGAGINILGVQPLGRTSFFLGALVLLPFVYMFIHFAVSGHAAVAPAAVKPHTGLSTFGLAIYTVMWNFIGWDNATTYADEVNRPARSYVIATCIAFVCIIAVYFGAVITAQHSGIDPQSLNEQGFPILGDKIGGRWLGTALAAGGMASALGIFLAVMLSVSRVPQVMADDGLLPKILFKTHPKYGTPYISVMVFAVITSFLVLFSFSELLFLDVTLYGFGLMLEFASLLLLRIKAPHDPRPFKIPLKIPGLIAMCLFPFAILIIALYASVRDAGWKDPVVLLTACCLLSAEIAWQFVSRRRANPLA